ncbi:transposase [Paenibacillus polymyxa]|nr:transposase [Paenibacillus polymyxa]MDY7989738.1 transposase [Paenibacillus polymyxa]MDY8046520.1 transposase [Paenibacillus polymyxa]MDY8116399.1 transposase [Paenibacillus polymyxa]
MGEIRKTYDVSFKNKTVDLYLKKGIGYKTVAREMEIDASLVRRWVRWSMPFKSISISTTMNAFKRN